MVLNIRSFTIKESEENKFFSPKVFILSIESIYNLQISASLISLYEHRTLSSLRFLMES